MYTINKITSHPTVDFAAEELKKYLRMMMPRAGEIPISYAPDAKDGFRLGTMADFGLDTSEAADLFMDDILHIDTDAQGGIIAGSNPRSVLLAVYKFLKLNGCRFLFPGRDGESIPIRSVEATRFHKLADHKFRGQCNEGSTAQDNYLEAIDFLPKIGMNCYMLEFDIPTSYYDYWYEHNHNPYYKSEKTTPEQILQWKRQCEAEIKKRSLVYHDMGHGWTALPFGLDKAGDWRAIDLTQDPRYEEMRQNFAMLNGKRDLYKGVPLNTNVCLSNPRVREKMACYIADYAEIQNNVDYLHIWLADARNNHCECEACRQKTTSDWYVILLNEIDGELTRRGLATRLVFISYNDTMFAPETEKLKHQERFTLLFAPIQRHYTENYTDDVNPEETKSYIRNKIPLPQNMGGCLGHLHNWKKNYSGYSFCYEYHFWRLQAYDPSYQFVAKCIYKDIQGLKKHGLDGIIEDSTPRNYMPSGLAQTVFGEALFDRSLSFEEIEEDYMSHAFGENWRLVRDFLDGLTDARVLQDVMRPQVDPETRKEIFNDPYVIERAADWKARCAAFRPVIAANAWQPVRCQTVLWQNLEYFLKVVELDADMLTLAFSGKAEECFKRVIAGERELGAQEYRYQRFFDLGLWGRCNRRLFNPEGRFSAEAPD